VVNKLLIERGFAVDATLHRVREDIISGRYAPNSKLFPKAIAEEHGTSFIPVREALRILESEGFVTFVNNRGTWVTPLSLDDAKDLYSTRIEIESLAVRNAAPFSAEELDLLNKILDEIHTHNAANRAAEVVKLNRRFHFSLYEKSNSPRRMRLIEQLWLHSERYQRVSVSQRGDAGDSEHRAILGALRQGNHDAAAELLAEHLRTTIDLLASRFTDESTNSSENRSSDSEGH
jgi:DNA-binding GntR family transcriptional regulator